MPSPAYHRLFIGTCFMLTACGARGNTATQSALPNVVSPVSTPTMQQAGSDAASAPVHVQLSYKLPTTTSQQSHNHRSLQFISASNTLISITVTPFGGSGTVYGPTACTAGSCAISFTAAPGPNTIAFTLTDGSANVLSKFSTTTIVQPATLNTLRFSANPVVNSVSLSLASPSVNAGTIVNDLLTINAQDVDGNTIAGTDNYVDANGSPLVLTLAVNNAQAGGNGTVTLQGPPRITAPGQAAVYARYDGKWLDHSDISVTASRPIGGSLSGTALATIPRIVNEYTIPTGATNAQYITTGADGNLWFTEFAANKIGRIIPNAPVPIAEFGGVTAPVGICAGPDGNLWYGGLYSQTLGKVTTAGNPTPISTTPYQPFGAALGPDGNLWFADSHSNHIIRVSTKGVMKAFTTATPTTDTSGIILGGDGNFWYTKQLLSIVGKMTPTGIFTEYTTLTSSSSPFDLALGADGNVWFTEGAVGKIGRITPAGSIVEFGTSAGTAGVSGITPGPDGNLWFVEGGVANKIGRITVNGTVSEWAAPSGAGMRAATFGPDGNLWITENGANKIGVFVL